MKIRISLAAFITILTAIPADGFLLPLLFPFQIKITFHAERKPPPIVTIYKYEKAPVYKEVVVKPVSSPYKESYGDGVNKGTSYGDGHHKVYVQEPHVKGHGYTHAYQTTPGPYDEVHYHYKGATYTTKPAYDDEAEKGYPPASSHVATPGNSYEDYASAYKSSRYPPAPSTQKAYDAKLYAGNHGQEVVSKSKYHKPASPYDDEHAATYLDDTLPGHGYAGHVVDSPYEEEFEPLRYAGFGSSFYGDSYAKIVYIPPRANINVKISAYSHK